MTETELYHYALFLLSRRDYGSQELKRRIKQRLYEKRLILDDETRIDRVLNRLQKQQYLDEQRAITVFLREHLRKLHGPLKIHAQLQHKGFSSNTITDALIPLNVNWVELAIRSREKRFGKQHPIDYKDKAKQVRYLQSQGFSAEMIFAQFCPP